MERIGIYGGTFNPIHVFHLIMAQHFVAQANLDFCYFVPAYISPFKVEDKKALDDVAHRINMVRLAIASNDKFRLCTYESDKGGVSYTYDTLRHMKENHPAGEYCILIGSDQAADFKKWNNWQNILDEATVYIAGRPDASKKNWEYLAGIPDFKQKTRMLEAPVSDLSSTYIRDLVKAGSPIKYLVPESVENYISGNKLYM